MELSQQEINQFKHSQDDIALHCKACQMADDECFRLYGTDSISDKDTLWPRWQELYQRVVDQVFPPYKWKE